MELETIIQGGAVGISIILIFLLWKMFDRMMFLLDKKNGQLERIAQGFTNTINDIKNELIQEIRESRKLHNDNYKDILGKIKS